MIFRIAIVAPRDAQMLDIFGPLDVFKEASRASQGKLEIRISVLSADEGDAINESGFRLSSYSSIHDADPDYDMTLVVGASDQSARPANNVLSQWLRESYARGQRIGSVCTGAFSLGDAGLLDGKEVTTHWADASELANRYPAAHVLPDRIYCRDDRIYTSAGVSAGIDLALAIVEEISSRQIAMNVAKQLVVFLKRPGGQSQFSAHLVAQMSEQPRIRRIQELILADLTADYCHKELAARAYMSIRSLLREFRNATGTTPRRFVEGARFDEARRLIEENALSLDAIAMRTGLGTREKMRRVFIRIIGVNPSDYRERFVDRHRSMQHELKDHCVCNGPF